MLLKSATTCYHKVRQVLLQCDTVHPSPLDVHILLLSPVFTNSGEQMSRDWLFNRRLAVVVAVVYFYCWC